MDKDNIQLLKRLGISLMIGAVILLVVYYYVEQTQTTIPIQFVDNEYFIDPENCQIWNIYSATSTVFRVVSPPPELTEYYGWVEGCHSEKLDEGVYNFTISEDYKIFVYNSSNAKYVKTDKNL